MDCSLPGFSVHGILQARILEWVTISFSRGSFQTRDRTQVSCIAGRCFNLWATLVAQLVKNLPAIQETWVQVLAWEDSPREGKGYPLQSMGSQRVRYHWETFTSLSLHCITNKNEFYLSSILTWWHFQNTIFKNYGRCIFPKTHGTFIQIGRKTSPNILK